MLEQSCQILERRLLEQASWAGFIGRPWLGLVWPFAECWVRPKRKPGGHNEGYADSFKQCFLAYYRALGAGQFELPVPFPTFADGHQEIQLCEAILASHRERRWVQVDPSSRLSES